MKYPVAYHITVTTYGTWVHGDERGSVNKTQNCYGSAFIDYNPVIKSKEQSVLKNSSVMLQPDQREIVLDAILQVCDYRGWVAHAVHVRSNHAHIVVCGKEKAEKMMVDFKAYATRALKKYSNNPKDIKKYWTRHGSTKYIWSEKKSCLCG